MFSFAKSEGTPLDRARNYNLCYSVVVTFKKTPETLRKEAQKTREKILRFIRETPVITTSELAEKSELTLKGVEWNIGKLKKEGLIKRVGPDKGGHWEVRG